MMHAEAISVRAIFLDFLMYPSPLQELLPGKSILFRAILLKNISAWGH